MKRRRQHLAHEIAVSLLEQQDVRTQFAKGGRKLKEPRRTSLQVPREDDELGHEISSQLSANGVIRERESYVSRWGTTAQFTAGPSRQLRWPDSIDTYGSLWGTVSEAASAGRGRAYAPT